jgi:hypothetical protein
MAAALLTLTGLSIAGLVASLLVALDVISFGESHVGLAVFATMLNLLAHSFMMFYLIGKGKAVREAVAEAGLDGDYVRRISRLRAPVFSQATLAMALTMAAGIMGSSVSTGSIASLWHAILAAAGVAWQIYALRLEGVALAGIGRVVDEVNTRLAHG